MAWSSGSARAKSWSSEVQDPGKLSGSAGLAGETFFMLKQGKLGLAEAKKVPWPIHLAFWDAWLGLTKIVMPVLLPECFFGVCWFEAPPKDGTLPSIQRRSSPSDFVLYGY
jgi:hypothetical protein